MARSWEAVRRVADRYESRIQRLVVDAARTGQAALDEQLLEMGMERGVPSIMESALVTSNAAMMTVLSAELPKLIEGAFVDAAKATLRQAQVAGSVLRAAKLPERPIDSLRFDLVNREAVVWIRTKSGAAITNISGTTLKAIRRILERAFVDGIPIDQAARLIRPLIGLTNVHVEAVLNLRRAMRDNPGKKIWAGRVPIRVPKDGASADLIRRRTESYADRLLNYRARLIARTEAVGASNEGQRQLWKQAIEKNLLNADIKREWIVTPDERLCPICENLNGEVRGIDEPFSVGVMSPPAHGLCRCSMGISIHRKSTPLRPKELEAVA